MKPRPLALTLGDPAGVGPEITVKAWQALRGEPLSFFVVGDYAMLAAASPAGAGVLQRITAPDQAPDLFPQALPVLDLPLAAAAVAGRPSAASAPSVIGWIETARYLERVLGRVPYGQGSALRHVVGGACGGGFEWTSGPDGQLVGITALNSVKTA